METSAEDIPDFSHHQDRWFERLEEWLAPQGLWAIVVREIDVYAYLPSDAPWIRIELKVAGAPHATVVVRKDGITWDPREGGWMGSDTISPTERLALLINKKDLKPHHGVLSRERFIQVMGGWNRMGHVTVLTNGVFDMIHAGHAKLLEEAARQGDRLAVAVNSDDSVKALKGPKRPIIGEDERAAMIASLGCVDAVCLFHELTPLELVSKCLPNVLVKGSDWKGNVVGSDVVELNGGRVHLVQRADDMLSTTRILDRIKEAMP